MKYKLMKKSGALQENVQNAPSAPRQSSMPPDFSSFSLHQREVIDEPWNVDEMMNDIHAQNMLPPEAPLLADIPPGTQTAATFGGAHTAVLRRSLAGRGGGGGEQSRQSGLEILTYTPVRHSMWFTVLREGERALVLDREGRGEIVTGPRRIFRWRKRIEHLSHYIAFPGEFLILKHRDGQQEHLPGPCELWLDPRIHSHVEKEDMLQIAAKEAVIVYAENDEEGGKVQRRVVAGPANFMPAPGEWLHTFRWHGSTGTSYKKVPGALVFQKLWLMPDQMYHDVEDVRTADDVVLQVKLMLFFELADVDRMLDETHDPIGDFINAATSDVIDFVGRYSFDEFKTRTEMLNDLNNYRQLKGRAEQVGYEIRKIVYRGYATSDALQSMHDQSIETRTRLKLERETEEQAQSLADFKQERKIKRARDAQEQEKDRENFRLEQEKLQHEQQLALKQKQRQLEREIQELDHLVKVASQKASDEQRLAYLRQLSEMGVEMTAYLTQGRADQVLELRGGDQIPHLHVTTDKD
jgi:hypothetical protein